jgi:acyl-CoA dehydrogenase
MDVASIVDTYWQDGAGNRVGDQPADILRWLGAAGVLKECALGNGTGFRTKIALAEALASRSAGLATAVLAHVGSPLSLLAHCGASSLLRDYHATSISGVTVATAAIPDAAWGAAATECFGPRIRFDGDDVVLDGKAGQIVNARHADFALVLAQSQGGETWVLVPFNSNGVSLVPMAMAALQPASFGTLEFSNCRLPGAHVLGERDHGLSDSMPALVEDRLIGSALLLAVARKAIDDCIKFVSTRPFEGRTLADMQLVRHRIADFQADYVIAKRYLEEWVQRVGDAEQATCEQTAGVTLVAAQAAQRIVDGCAQLYGGRGFLREFGAALATMDTLAARFRLGAPEAARHAVARDMNAKGHPMFTDKHDAFRLRMRAVADEHIVPHLDAFERDGVSRALFAAMGKAGVFKALAPRAYGGLGFDFMHSMVIAEEFMRHRAVGVGSSLMLQANTLCPILSRYGSAAIREQFLAPLMEGTAIGALAVTEPGGGSALMTAVKCEAVPDGDTWVINGEKMFITNGPIADVVVVLARTESKPGPFSMSLIAVPTGTQGFSVVDTLDKLGLNSSPVGRLRFENCRVPKANLVGMRGKGYLQVADTMKEERLLIAIGSIALAESCLSETLPFLEQRHQGGLPTALSQELGQCRAELDAARAFAYATARDVVDGNVSMIATSIAKFRVCETVQKIIQRCVELHGSAGLTDGSWTERVYRDSRVLSVYAGTSDTNRELVGQRLLPEALRRGK